MKEEFLVETKEMTRWTEAPSNFMSPVTWEEGQKQKHNSHVSSGVLHALMGLLDTCFPRGGRVPQLGPLLPAAGRPRPHGGIVQAS